MVRLVLFDIDGTLIRTNGAGVDAFGRAFTNAFGLPRATDGIRFAGRTDVSLVREIFERAGVKPTPLHFSQFFDQYVFWLDHLMSSCDGSVCPGVNVLLAELRAMPNPPVIGLLTGNIRLGAEIKLRHFTLWEHFVLGGYADDHEDRSGIAAAAKARGERHLGRALNGAEVVVVGDTGHDVRCGRAIGAKVLAVATGGETRQQLQTHNPDWLVNDLREITARDLCAS